MNKRWRERFQKELTEDAMRIMEEVNSDPSLKDVEAPDEMFENIMKQIHEQKATESPVEDTRLTTEEKELIRLGKVYQKRRKWNRYVVIAAAVIAMLAIGTTSLGGPKRVIEIVREFVDERERTKINTDNERVDGEQAQSEYETFLAIEKEFGCKVVDLDYLPKNLKFVEGVIEEESQNARLYYEDEKGKVLSYVIWFNYRSTVTGVDVEDEILKSYDLEVGETVVTIKQYQVKGGDDSRWRAEFEHQKVRYFIVMNGFSEDEVEKIVKNLYFY